MLAPGKDLFEQRKHNLTQLDVLYSLLLSDKEINNPHQLANGKSLTSWQILLLDSMTEVRVDGQKIDSGFKTNLGLKTISGPKDRNSLLQDLLMIIRGDKALLKPILEAGKNHHENLKKRSMSLFLTKQLFSAQSSMRFLKR